MTPHASPDRSVPTTGNLFRQVLLRCFDGSQYADDLARSGRFLATLIKIGNPASHAVVLERTIHGLLADAVFLAGYLQYEVNTSRGSGLEGPDLQLAEEAERLGESLLSVVMTSLPTFRISAAKLPTLDSWELHLPCQERILFLIEDHASTMALRALFGGIYRYGLAVDFTTDSSTVSSIQSRAQAAALDLQELRVAVGQTATVSPARQQHGLWRLERALESTIGALSVHVSAELRKRSRKATARRSKHQPKRVSSATASETAQQPA